MLKRIKNRLKRKKKIRKRISGTSKVPRVCVYKSNKRCYVQVVNDNKAITLYGIAVSISDKTEKRWYNLGVKVGKYLVKNNIKKIVFDRGGYKYNGRVKAVADGIRSEKVKF